MFKLAVKSKQEFQQEMAKEMQIFFSELLASIGTTKKGERDDAGARIVEGLEQLVKATASEVIGEKLIVCNRAVKWWDEEVEAIGVRRETHAR